MYEEELYHHGVKGMKWGVRKARNKERAARNAAAKAITGQRKKEFLSVAEKHRKDADRIRDAHYKAKAEGKNMRLLKDGNIVEISKSEQAAKGKKAVKGALIGVGAAAAVGTVATAAVVHVGRKLAKEIFDIGGMFVRDIQDATAGGPGIGLIDFIP